MTQAPRPHLIERAAELLGRGDGTALAPPPPGTAAPGGPWPAPPALGSAAGTTALFQPGAPAPLPPAAPAPFPSGAAAPFPSGAPAPFPPAAPVPPAPGAAAPIPSGAAAPLLPDPVGPAAPRLGTPAIARATLYRAGLVTPLKAGRRQRVLEELGLIHHQVLRCIDESKIEPSARRRIVLVASALKQEGKSFVALNLAAGIASSGARPVLLVDADGAAGAMTSLLGGNDRPGVMNMVASPDMPPSAVAMPTGIRRLSFVPYGAIRRSDVPSGSTMAQAILRLAAALPEHVLVIDPPPCLSTSDCSALAGVSGQVVFVVDAQRTLTDEVEAALDVLDACPVTRLLLNRMQLNTPDTFGAHGEYGAPNAT